MMFRSITFQKLGIHSQPGFTYRVTVRKMYKNSHGSKSKQSVHKSLRGQSGSRQEQGLRQTG